MKHHPLVGYELEAHDLVEWERRTAFERGALGDPVWRLANLYECQNQDGETVRFVPSPEQRLVIWCIFVLGWQRIIIPKARQLGMSLMLSLICLDQMLFKEGFRASWIDKTRPDARKKLKDKMLFAFDRLPESVREGVTINRRTLDEFAVQSKGEELSPESLVSVGINYRGGTVEGLVCSEWGWIQAYDRLRSKEINDGALPAVERASEGWCVVETTWEGGLDGELGPYVAEALRVPEEQKGRRSWRILFFGWHTDRLYRQSHGYVDAESAKYFQEAEAMGLVLEHEQKLWYAERRRTKSRVKAEFPSFAHECWDSMPEGSIYGAWIERAKDAGRINDFQTDTRWPVHTFWDLGLPINTVCWLIQVTPQEIRVLDVQMELDITLVERWARLRAKGFTFGTHYLPWEADAAGTTGIKDVDEFRRVCGPNVRIVPVTHNKWTAITATREMFGRFVFHATNCEVGLEHLKRYRAERATSSGIAKDVPVHDKYSHAADAFRQCVQAIHAGMIEGGQAVGAVVQKSANAGMVRRAAR